MTPTKRQIGWMPPNVMSVARFGMCLWVGFTNGSCAASPEGVRQPTVAALEDLRVRASSLVGWDTLPPATMTRKAAERWQRKRSAIVNARPGPVLGSLDGDSVDVLGLPVDVELISDGRFYVLDGVNARLLLSDSTGRVLDWFGQHGDGPRDFRQPAALATLDSQVAVAQFGGVKLFERTGNEHEFRTIYPGFSASSLCYTGDGRILGAAVSRASKTFIREYEGSSMAVVPEQVAQFGRGYDFGGSRASAVLMRGSMACYADQRRVVYAFQYLPAIESYSLAGEQLWAVMLSVFEQGWFVESNAGRRLSFPGLPRETLVGLADEADGYVIATYDKWQDAVFWERRSYLIDAATGEGALLEEGQHGVIAAMDSVRFLRISYNPYPRVQLWYMDNSP